MLSSSSEDKKVSRYDSQTFSTAVHLEVKLHDLPNEASPDQLTMHQYARGTFVSRHS